VRSQIDELLKTWGDNVIPFSLGLFGTALVGPLRFISSCGYRLP
jgi:hypothetical protein